MGFIAVRRRYRANLKIVSSRLNCDGFTLVEVMWVMMLFTLLLAMLISVQMMLQTQMKMDEHRSHLVMESQAFVSYITKEIEQAQLLQSTDSQELTLTMKDGRKIKYYTSGTRIVRSVKETSMSSFGGFTILLLNLKDVVFNVSPNQKGMKITISIGEGNQEMTFEQFITSNIK